MAAPRFAPVDPLDDVRTYGSPDHVPEPWMPDRPGDLAGGQPEGRRLGFQGPDQGYALVLARRLRDDVHVQPDEDRDDALHGCTAIGLRRASLLRRAPVIHDIRLPLTVWGFLDPAPPAELVELRRRRFAGVANVVHHYDARRDLVDSVPEATLRLTPEQARERYPAEWRSLVGA